MPVIKSKILYFLIPFVISLVLVPLIKKVAWKLGIFARENNRTIHHGRIPRIGGISIYVAFMIGCVLFVKADRPFQSMLIGGFIVFIGGLIDDIYDLRARYKLLFQIIGALVVIIYGNVGLGELHLPFNIIIPETFISNIITFLWLIGITNAINLLDGLDGLSTGFSIIVLLTISLLTTVNNRKDILQISLILTGASAGFLGYNFHPASIFVGDSGAQFLGFMIASISLLGYKGGTVITLLIPIIILFIPIMDTLSSIIRRKIEGHGVFEADMGHIHHSLMRTFGLGQAETVIIIYLIAIVFGIVAYIYALNQIVGLALLVLVVLSFEILMEITGMLSTNYHPVLSIIRKLKRTNKKAD